MVALHPNRANPSLAAQLTVQYQPGRYPMVSMLTAYELCFACHMYMQWRKYACWFVIICCKDSMLLMRTHCLSSKGPLDFAIYVEQKEPASPFQFLLPRTKGACSVRVCSTTELTGRLQGHNGSRVFEETQEMERQVPRSVYVS